MVTGNISMVTVFLNTSLHQILNLILKRQGLFTLCEHLGSSPVFEGVFEGSVLLIF